MHLLYGCDRWSPTRSVQLSLRGMVAILAEFLERLDHTLVPLDQPALLSARMREFLAAS